MIHESSADRLGCHGYAVGTSAPLDAQAVVGSAISAAAIEVVVQAHLSGRLRDDYRGLGGAQFSQRLQGSRRG